MGGMGFIYYTAISRYAEDHGITDESFGELLVVLRAMDAVYVKWAADEAKRAAEQNKG